MAGILDNYFTTQFIPNLSLQIMEICLTLIIVLTQMGRPYVDRQQMSSIVLRIHLNKCAIYTHLCSDDETICHGMVVPCYMTSTM